VAAAVLLSAEPPQGPVDVSGREVINGEQLARLASETLRKTVQFVGLPADTLLEELVAARTPRPRALAKVARRGSG
jgi:hypothetical protein